MFEYTKTIVTSLACITLIACSVDAGPAAASKDASGPTSDVKEGAMPEVVEGEPASSLTGELGESASDSGASVEPVSENGNDVSFVVDGGQGLEANQGGGGASAQGPEAGAAAGGTTVMDGEEVDASVGEPALAGDGDGIVDSGGVAAAADGMCSSGQMLENGVCRVLITCAGLACDAGCQEGGGEQDATCLAAACSEDEELKGGVCTTIECGESEILSEGECVPGECGEFEQAKGPLCVPCGDCAAQAADGRSTGELASGFSDSGKCSCEPAEGYFFDEASAVLEPCDEDGDRWIAKSAQRAMTSGDPFVQTLAKCRRYVSTAVVLHSDISVADGEPGVETVSTGFVLVEADRIDRAVQLAGAADGDLAPYSGVAFAANELNSLTKFCGSVNGDYNALGGPDVDERQGAGEGSDNEVALSEFSHFAELHRSWFVVSDDTSCQTTSRDTCGIYHIAERPRVEAATVEQDVGVGARPPLALTYQDDANEYWQSCIRHTSAGAGVTHDFAELRGQRMRHYSQFKCMRTADAGDAELTKEQVVEAKANAELVWNNCATAKGEAREGTTALDVEFDCQSADAPSGPGQVAFVSIAYPESGQGPTDAVSRGCINECQRQYDLPEHLQCESYKSWALSPSTATWQCKAATAEFGKVSCQCEDAFGGERCEIACGYISNPGNGAPEPRFLSTQADSASSVGREGYWMCAEISNGLPDAQLLAQPSVEVDGSNYVLTRSKITTTGPTRNTNGIKNNGYQLF